MKNITKEAAMVDAAGMNNRAIKQKEERCSFAKHGFRYIAENKRKCERDTYPLLYFAFKNAESL